MNKETVNQGALMMLLTWMIGWSDKVLLYLKTSVRNMCSQLRYAFRARERYPGWRSITLQAKGLACVHKNMLSSSPVYSNNVFQPC